MKRGWKLKRTLLLFAFELLYHQFAWAYDLVSSLVSKGQWRTWQRAALTGLYGRRVLEIGPGPGHLLADLAERGYSCCGLELSRQMVRLARRNLRKRGFPCCLVRGRAEAIPFVDNAFDCVVLTFPAGYVREVGPLREIYRVLVIGGRVVIVDSAYLREDDATGRLLNWAHSIPGESGASIPLPRLADLGFTVAEEEQANEAGGAHVVILTKTG